MKSWIFLASFVVSTVAVADVGPADLTFRSSDPFLFCHEGQDITKKPDRCWWPVAPYTGGMAFVNAPWCQPEDPEGKAWDSDDTLSMQEYQLVCPVAGTSGEWKGTPGGESRDPTQH